MNKSSSSLLGRTDGQLDKGSPNERTEYTRQFIKLSDTSLVLADGSLNLQQREGRSWSTEAGLTVEDEGTLGNLGEINFAL